VTLTFELLNYLRPLYSSTGVVFNKCEFEVSTALRFKKI